MPDPHQTTLIAGLDIYSPEPIFFSGTMRLYFGNYPFDKPSYQG